MSSYMQVKGVDKPAEEAEPEVEQRTEEYEITDLPVPQEVDQQLTKAKEDLGHAASVMTEAVKRFDSREKRSITDRTLEDPDIPFEEFSAQQIRLYQEQSAQKAAAKEQVRRPSHYDIHESGIQVIDVIQFLSLSFECGNALKYICRAGRKDDNPRVQDLKKAIFYLQLEVAKLNRQSKETEP